MRPRSEIVAFLSKAGPLTQAGPLALKVQEAMLEVLLDIRDLQIEFNDRLLNRKPDAR